MKIQQWQIIMSDNTKQLTGFSLFMYLRKRFSMSVSDSYEEMIEHKQDTKDIELLFLDVYDMLSADGNAIANKLRQKHIKEFV